MRSYHCYFLDHHGLIAARRVLMCLDDAEMAALAPSLLAEEPSYSGLEVWDRSRRVSLHRTPGRPSPAPH